MISWPGAVGEGWKFGGSVTRSPKQRWPGWIGSSSLGLRGLLVFFFFVSDAPSGGRVLT